MHTNIYSRAYPYCGTGPARFMTAFGGAGLPASKTAETVRQGESRRSGPRFHSVAETALREGRPDSGDPRDFAAIHKNFGLQKSIF